MYFMRQFIVNSIITFMAIVIWYLIVKWFNKREKKEQKIGYHDLETNSMLYFTQKELKEFLDKKDEKKAKTINWVTKSVSSPNNTLVDSVSIPKETLVDFDFSSYLLYRLKELLYIEDQMNTHKAVWGVPVGPTLSMCVNSDFRGIKFSDEKDDLSVQYTLNSPFVNDASTPFINDIQAGLFSHNSIARYNVEAIVKLNTEQRKVKPPYDPYYRIKFEYGFDLRAWEMELLSVINKIVNTEQAEVAIEALPIYDKLRRLMDIMQAVPPARRKKNDENL